MIGKELFLGMISGETMPRMQEIEDFAAHHPWCAIGHKLLFSALCAQNEEAYLFYLSKASAYVFNRAELFTMAHSPRPLVPMAASPLFAEEPVKTQSHEVKPVEEFEIISDPVERIVIAGGDYFAKSDLNSAPLEDHNPIDRFIKTNPKLTPVQLFQEPQEEKVSLLDVDEDNFMTETLAKIYADQSLYQLAIEAYKKLILLYPKKSDYFASLIRELKQNKG